MSQELNLSASSHALDEETARAEVYGLLSQLYYQAPGDELLGQLQVAVTEAPDAHVAPGFPVIGVIGGGQLARMLAIAAAQLGYRSHIFAPEASGPAADVSACWTQADYEDGEEIGRAHV